MLNGRRILLIIGGGIAAYKSLQLIRELREPGAMVTPVMTTGAAECGTRIRVAALATGKDCKDLFAWNDESEMGQIG